MLILASVRLLYKLSYPSVSHIHQQMRNIGLLTLHMFDVLFCAFFGISDGLYE
jgi:hypothetical protein